MPTSPIKPQITNIMPTLASTLTSLSTPAHTFRATKSVNADVRVESDEVILIAALPVAEGGSDTATILEIAAPNAAAEIVGICMGAEVPMVADFFKSGPTSLGTIKFGGGANDTITDGLGDLVWPSYEGHAAPSATPQDLDTILGGGDIIYISIKRSGVDGAIGTATDNATDYPDGQPLRIAIFYNSN